MAVRTTPEKVGEIVELDTEFSVTPFIEAANYLVTRACASAVITGTTTPFYTDTELELIERWLSAHFYCILDPRSIRDQVSSLQTQYENRVDLGLDITRYGQQAKLLDVNGGLARLDALATSGKKRLVAKLKWGGTPNDEVFGRRAY